SDIIAEGYDKDEILVEFKNRKNKMHSSFRDIAEDTLTNSKVMTKEELATEIGL
ncbi:TPA: AbrB family transcriptional regulator, partial [Enterococcus faecium]|nr:AbrB family transcriptional regulator [Enterococcus faecium]HBL2785565.1 AbrB family transcriptional regulator [Enterococcus faecium]